MQVALWIFNLKLEFRRAIEFTYLQALAYTISRSSKEIYCRTDIQALRFAGESSSSSKFSVGVPFFQRALEILFFK